MGNPETADQIIAAATFRRNVYACIPQGASRILDFGAGSGGLLLRLQRDKGCRELYGIEIDRAASRPLRPLLDGLWHLNIEDPAQDLPAEYRGFFNYVVMHDVVEHLYDPWYCLARIRRWLAPGGRLVLATPNLQFWDFLLKLLSGEFPYGHGLWHVGHIRWFTVRSLVEMLAVAGFEIERLALEIHYNLDRASLESRRGVREVSLPPAEVAHLVPPDRTVRLAFPADVGPAYPVFLAHKLLAVCRAGAGDVEPVRMADDCDKLHRLRQALNNPFDVYSPPRLELLVGDWC